MRENDPQTIEISAKRFKSILKKLNPQLHESDGGEAVLLEFLSDHSDVFATYSTDWGETYCNLLDDYYASSVPATDLPSKTIMPTGQGATKDLEVMASSSPLVQGAPIAEVKECKVQSVEVHASSEPECSSSNTTSLYEHLKENKEEAMSKKQFQGLQRKVSEEGSSTHTMAASSDVNETHVTKHDATNSSSSDGNNSDDRIETRLEKALLEFLQQENNVAHDVRDISNIPRVSKTLKRLNRGLFDVAGPRAVLLNFVTNREDVFEITFGAQGSVGFRIKTEPGVQQKESDGIEEVIHVIDENEKEDEKESGKEAVTNTNGTFSEKVRFCPQEEKLKLLVCNYLQKCPSKSCKLSALNLNGKIGKVVSEISGLRPRGEKFKWKRFLQRCDHILDYNGKRITLRNTHEQTDASCKRLTPEEEHLKSLVCSYLQYCRSSSCSIEDLKAKAQISRVSSALFLLKPRGQPFGWKKFLESCDDVLTYEHKSKVVRLKRSSLDRTLNIPKEQSASGKPQDEKENISAKVHVSDHNLTKLCIGLKCRVLDYLDKVPGQHSIEDFLTSKSLVKALKRLRKDLEPYDFEFSWELFLCKHQYIFDIDTCRSIDAKDWLISLKGAQRTTKRTASSIDSMSDSCLRSCLEQPVKTTLTNLQTTKTASSLISHKGAQQTTKKTVSSIDSCSRTCSEVSNTQSVKTTLTKLQTTETASSIPSMTDSCSRSFSDVLKSQPVKTTLTNLQTTKTAPSIDSNPDSCSRSSSDVSVTQSKKNTERKISHPKNFGAFERSLRTEIVNIVKHNQGPLSVSKLASMLSPLVKVERQLGGKKIKWKAFLESCNDIVCVFQKTVVMNNRQWKDDMVRLTTGSSSPPPEPPQQSVVKAKLPATEKVLYKLRRFFTADGSLWHSSSAPPEPPQQPVVKTKLPATEKVLHELDVGLREAITLFLQQEPGEHSMRDIQSNEDIIQARTQLQCRMTSYEVSFSWRDFLSRNAQYFVLKNFDGAQPVCRVRISLNLVAQGITNNHEPSNQLMGDNNLDDVEEKGASGAVHVDDLVATGIPYDTNGVQSREGNPGVPKQKVDLKVDDGATTVEFSPLEYSLRAEVIRILKENKNPMLSERLAGETKIHQLMKELKIEQPGGEVFKWKTFLDKCSDVFRVTQRTIIEKKSKEREADFVILKADCSNISSCEEKLPLTPSVLNKLDGVLRDTITVFLRLQPGDHHLREIQSNEGIMLARMQLQKSLIPYDRSFTWNEFLTRNSQYFELKNFYGNQPLSGVTLSLLGPVNQSSTHRNESTNLDVNTSLAPEHDSPRERSEAEDVLLSEILCLLRKVGNGVTLSHLINFSEKVRRAVTALKEDCAKYGRQFDWIAFLSGARQISPLVVTRLETRDMSKITLGSLANDDLEVSAAEAFYSEIQRSQGGGTRDINPDNDDVEEHDGDDKTDDDEEEVVASCVLHVDDLVARSTSSDTNGVQSEEGNPRGLDVGLKVDDSADTVAVNPLEYSLRAEVIRILKESTEPVLSETITCKTKVRELKKELMLEQPGGEVFKWKKFLEKYSDIFCITQRSIIGKKTKKKREADFVGLRGDSSKISSCEEKLTATPSVDEDIYDEEGSSGVLQLEDLVARSTSSDTNGVEFGEGNPRGLEHDVGLDDADVEGCGEESEGNQVQRSKKGGTQDTNLDDDVEEDDDDDETDDDEVEVASGVLHVDDLVARSTRPSDTNEIESGEGNPRGLEHDSGLKIYDSADTVAVSPLEYSLRAEVIRILKESTEPVLSQTITCEMKVRQLKKELMLERPGGEVFKWKKFLEKYSDIFCVTQRSIIGKKSKMEIEADFVSLRGDSSKLTATPSVDEDIDDEEGSSGVLQVDDLVARSSSSDTNGVQSVEGNPRRLEHDVGLDDADIKGCGEESVGNKVQRSQGGETQDTKLDDDDLVRCGEESAGNQAQRSRGGGTQDTNLDDDDIEGCGEESVGNQDKRSRGGGMQDTNLDDNDVNDKDEADDDDDEGADDALHVNDSISRSIQSDTNGVDSEEGNQTSQGKVPGGRSSNECCDSPVCNDDADDDDDKPNEEAHKQGSDEMLNDVPTNVQDTYADVQDGDIEAADARILRDEHTTYSTSKFDAEDAVLNKIPHLEGTIGGGNLNRVEEDSEICKPTADVDDDNREATDNHTASTNSNSTKNKQELFEDSTTLTHVHTNGFSMVTGENKCLGFGHREMIDKHTQTQPSKERLLALAAVKYRTPDALLHNLQAVCEGIGLREVRTEEQCTDAIHYCTAWIGGAQVACTSNASLDVAKTAALESALDFLVSMYR